MTDKMVQKGIDKAIKRAEWYHETYKGCKDHAERCARQFIVTVIAATGERSPAQTRQIQNACPAGYRQSKAWRRAITYGGLTV